MENKAKIKADSIWDRLEKTAKRTGKTLNQASEATGISSGTISGWKTSHPNIKSLIKMAEFYDVSLDYIVYGKLGDQNITEQEHSLLMGFRSLDERDKEDILGNIHQKIENMKAKKGDVSSNSEIA